MEDFLLVFREGYTEQALANFLATDMSQCTEESLGDPKAAELHVMEIMKNALTAYAMPIESAILVASAKIRYMSGVWEFLMLQEATLGVRAIVGNKDVEKHVRGAP